MLSRVAESLYWIGRYVERGETLARLVDAVAARGGRWSSVFAVAALPAPENPTAADAVARIAFGDDDGLSIVGCIRAARRNALGVRAELTTEVWEALNGVYLFAEATSPRAIGPDGASSFLRSVRDAGQAFAGICDATLSHDDAWEFLVIGRYLERASMTARILREHADDGSDARQRLLEACCAAEPFARASRQSYDTGEALAFVALADAFPRSVRFALREVDRALHRLSATPAGSFTNAAERVAGRIAATLDFASAVDLAAEGSAPFAARVTVGVEELGEAIVASYFPGIPVA